MTTEHNSTINEIKKIIKSNNIFVTEINQILHNSGVEFNSRLDIIVTLIYNKYYGKDIKVNISDNVVDTIMDLFDVLVIDTDELFQKIFMFYCNKKTKINLDQYYTPVTIGQFICKLMKPGKKLIDPACGTGDLVKNYHGYITLWDISTDVLPICKSNYDLNQKEYDTMCIDSIADSNRDNAEYDYCCLNPPFGSQTVITNVDILNKYVLGKGKTREEIGIIFIERAINLVKTNGIVFIILPNGYLGNSTEKAKSLREYLLTYRIISIIEFPRNTFSRSGTGVSTSLLIVQKIKVSKSYNIFIRKLENIGYILNKKNTPYKYKTIDGHYVIQDGKPVLDNDFVDCYRDISRFIKQEKIENMSIKTDNTSLNSYECINSDELEKNILDINRYLNQYTSLIDICKIDGYKLIDDYIQQNVNSKFSIVHDKEYIYLDIKQITSPIYNKNNYIYGYDLPCRAKIRLEKYDIIVSKLKGKISFTIILDDSDNIVCSNGFTLLRPIDYNSTIVIFANLFSVNFTVQHNSLCTGSIMESLSDTDIKKIYINKDIDFNKYNSILEALTIINNTLYY